jgi:hypothetical protein
MAPIKTNTAAAAPGGSHRAGRCNEGHANQSAPKATPIRRIICDAPTRQSPVESDAMIRITTPAISRQSDNAKRNGRRKSRESSSEYRADKRISRPVKRNVVQRASGSPLVAYPGSAGMTIGSTGSRKTGRLKVNLLAFPGMEDSHCGITRSGRRRQDERPRR